MSETNNDRPWTEAQWERFFYESDVRAARYGDLLETLHDHPDCEEIIEREMGWEDDEDDEDGEGDEDLASLMEAEALEIELDDDAEDEDEDTDDVESTEPDEDFSARLDRADRRKIPGYAAAFDWGLRTHQTLQPFVQLLEEPEPDNPLLVAYGQCLVVAVKLMGGHSMNADGDDDTLGANIVCCRRSLAAANETLAALEQLREQSVVPADVTDPLLAEGEDVRRQVEARIAELRSRVWWE